MKGTYRIKNFKVFDEKGVEVPFAPITIFTGCNSSGKSSVVQSMLALDDFLAHIKEMLDNRDRFNLADYKIDFSHQSLLKLGSFENVCNKSAKTKEITITYDMFSNYIFEDISVELVFYMRAEDELKNGYLKKMSIWKKDATLIYSLDLTDNTVSADFGKIKDAFFVFSILQYDFIKWAWREQELEYNSEAPSEADEKLWYNFNRIPDENKEYISAQLLKPHAKEIISSDEQYEAFHKMQKANCIHYLPIFDEIKDKTKEDAALYIFEKGSTYAKERYGFLLKWFVGEYMKDSDLSIPEFFKKMEDKYLQLTKVPKDQEQVEDICGRPEQKTIEAVLNGRFLQLYKSQDQIDFLLQDGHYHYLFHDIFDMFACFSLSEDNPYCDVSKFEVDEIMNDVSQKSLNYSLFKQYVEGIVVDALTPDFSKAIYYCGSEGLLPQRYYSVNDSEIFRDYFDGIVKAGELSGLAKQGSSYSSILGKNRDSSPQDYQPGTFLNEWVKQFELGDHISFEYDTEKAILAFRLHQSADDPGMLIADQGRGITQLLSTLLSIETNILATYATRYVYEHAKRKTFSPPLTVTLTMEEPECHLHPKLQSLLADMLVDAYKNHGIEFIVETHSEYLIRKLQVLTAKKEIDSSKISLLYVYGKDDNENVSRVKRIGIRKDGTLSETFGPGFFDEATDLTMDLLRF